LGRETVEPVQDDFEVLVEWLWQLQLLEEVPTRYETITVGNQKTEEFEPSQSMHVGFDPRSRSACVNSGMGSRMQLLEASTRILQPCEIKE
jgi:hypothetical protein